jgi:hypothetical protein
MANRDPSFPTSMPTILRYGIAVLSVAIAIGLDLFLLRHFEAIFDATRRHLWLPCAGSSGRHALSCGVPLIDGSSRRV